MQEKSLGGALEKRALNPFQDFVVSQGSIDFSISSLLSFPLSLSLSRSIAQNVD